MPDIENYVTEANHVRVVLQGPSGTGKSYVASQFPAPWFFDFDVNLGGVLRTLTAQGKRLPVGFDHIDRDESGKEVPMRSRYARLVEKTDKALADDRVKTFVFDSATKFVDILIEETLRKQNKATIQDYKDLRQFWGFFARSSADFFEILSKVRRHIVLICHEKAKQDEKGNIILPYEVNWPGIAGQIIGAYFTDVWRCEVEKKFVTGEQKWIHQIRTMPDIFYKLKNSFGLPPIFEFNWDIIQKKLNETIKK